MLQTGRDFHKIEIHRLKPRRHRFPSLRLVIARKTWRKFPGLEEHFFFFFFIYRLNTQTHSRPRLDLNNVHLYIYPLKDSMKKYNRKIFCFHKLLALKFQLGFDSTISLIGIWYLTLDCCPIYGITFSYRMNSVLVKRNYWQDSWNFSHM